MRRTVIRKAKVFKQFGLWHVMGTRNDSPTPVRSFFTWSGAMHAADNWVRYGI